jgi:hypothetical protein
LGTIAVFTAGVWAQQQTILRVEGNVYVNDRPVERTNELLPPNFKLRTEKGRVEVRLRNGTMTLGENSAVSVDWNSPYNFERLEMLKGSAVLKTGEQGFDLLCEDSVKLSDDGVFRLDLTAAPNSQYGEHECRLRVFQGAAAVKLSTVTVAMHNGETMGLNRRCGDMIPLDKFDVAKRDDFDKWGGQP